MAKKTEILDLVAKYQQLIHDQSRELFEEVFSKDENCNLISIVTQFQGRESIFNDFIIGGIQKAYSKIDLIADEINVYEINETLATVVFKYHTECIRRDSGEPFGFAGVETQVMIKEEGNWKILHVHYSK